MTLLAARPCRLLRAPHAAVGALRCLQRAATTVAARSQAAEEGARAEGAGAEGAGAEGAGAEGAGAEGKVEVQEKREVQQKSAVQQNSKAQQKSEAQQKREPQVEVQQKTPKLLYTYRRLDLTEYREYQHSRLTQPLITPNYRDSRVVAVNSAILIPASVTATPQHFVDQMEPVDASLLPKRNLALFLVTPSFAPWLLDDRVFLEKALERLYKNLTTPAPVLHAICAVVSKLPAATPLRPHQVSKELDNRAVRPPVNETGFEGIAYLTLPSKAELSARPQPPGELGCIDFLVHTHTRHQAKHNHRLRLPLANTIFHTAKPSTLINSTWERRANGSALQRRTQHVRQTAAINLSAEDPKPVQAQKTPVHQEAFALSIPLLPLTSPRQVAGHMGNIIRGIIGPDGNTITASTELEHVVPQYFKSRGESAQATSAWALVIPNNKAQAAQKRTRKWLRHALPATAGTEAPDAAKNPPNSGQEEITPETWQAFWKRDPPLWHTSIQKLITSGARLHKVLSGGGGWGKKAGLLSLDPVPFGPPEPLKQNENMNEADDFESVSDFSTALRPVVQDGDFIQFFISPQVAQTQHASTFQHLKSLEKSAPKHAWSWEFGVVPSTVDSIPGGSWQHTTAASEDMVAFRGSFGALTEGGMTLMRGLNASSRTGLAKPLGTTLIDVPFSRWSAVRLFPNQSKTKKAGSSTAAELDHSKTEPKTDIDSIHDAPTLTVSSPSTSATASSPFRTSRRLQDNQKPNTHLPTAGAKRTFAKLRDIYVMRDPEQGLESVVQQKDSKLETQANLTCTTPYTSPQPEGPAHPLLRKIVPNDPGRIIVRRLIANTETRRRKFRMKEPVLRPGKGETRNQREHDKQVEHHKDAMRHLQQDDRAIKKPDEEALVAHKQVSGTHKKAVLDEPKAQRHGLKLHEEGQKCVEMQKPWQEKKSGHITIRRVLAALPSHPDTKTERAKPSAAEMAERTRISGKILARLTEQLRLITGWKGSALSALGQWKQRSRTPTSTSLHNRRRNLVRQIKPKANNSQAPGRTTPASHSPTATAEATRNPPAHDHSVPAHHSPHARDFRIRSIPLSPTTTSTWNHTFTNIRARLRALIHRTHLLTLHLSTLLPNTPVSISKHAAKPLHPQHRAGSPLRRNRPPTRLRVRNAPSQPLGLGSRPGGVRGLEKEGTVPVPVRKFPTVGLRVTRLKGVARRREKGGERKEKKKKEKARALEEEVEEWLGRGAM